MTKFELLKRAKKKMVDRERKYVGLHNVSFGSIDWYHRWRRLYLKLKAEIDEAKYMRG